jgi:tRNA threonylcarbamoyladenosine biosynthesis protein TsaB
MKILAFDTSAFHTTIAIVDGDKVVGKITDLERYSHNKILISSIVKLLESSSIQLEDIDLFAAGAGPGSFTGLRVGISTIKALAFGAGKPFKGVSSIDAIALKFAVENRLNKGELLRVYYDGRQRDLFTADYMFDGKSVERTSKIEVVQYSDMSDNGVNYIVGYKEGESEVETFINDILPDGEYIAYLANRDFKGDGEGDDFEPHYYKDFTIRR